MLVKVVNDNVYPYRENFRGKEIYIGPKQSIEMDVNEANLFLGTMPGNIRRLANGEQDPETFKRLRIETGGAKVTAQAPKFKCMADGKEFNSQAELDAYIAETHVDTMVDEDAKEKVVAKKKGRTSKGG